MVFKNLKVGDKVKVITAQRKWDGADAYAGYEGIITFLDKNRPACIEIKGETSILIIVEGMTSKLKLQKL